MPETEVKDVVQLEMTRLNEVKPRISVVVPTFKREKSLLRTVESIVASNYNNVELIIVDMGNLSNSASSSLKKIGQETGVKIEILHCGNVYVSNAINLGLPHTSSNLILLCSDDVVLEKDTIQNLVNILLVNGDIGIICPICCYLKDKNRIWWAGSKINMWTSKMRFYGVDSPFPLTEIFDSDTFTTVALVRRELFYNKDRGKMFFVDPNEFPIHYEEVDFSFRAKAKGWKVCITKRAKAYHDVPTPEGGDVLRVFGVHTPKRAYFSLRNRVIFHKKYSTFWQFLAFILVFVLLFLLYYPNVILFKSKRPIAERIKILRSYLRGFIDSLSWRPAIRFVNLMS